VVQFEITIGIKRAIVVGRTQPSSDGLPEGLIDQLNLRESRLNAA